MTEGRAQWSTGIGFILAAMGSAIGFGSISRFPMNVANGGGAAFLLLYAILMLAVGVPMLVAEFSIGRRAQKNVVGAFTHLEGNPRTKWRFSGIFFFVFAGFFLSYYSVLAGWVARYVWASFTGGFFGDPNAYLVDTIEGPDALFWHFVTLALTFFVVTSNVSKGIERLNLILLPLLFVIILGLAIYAATLPGGGAGYEFYLKPDFGEITVPVVAAVIGQVFFSLGVGLGAMLTYASYLPKRASLARNATIISVSTLVFATICGLMVFPMLAAYGMLGGGAAGFDLIFGPLAQAFSQMGSPLGNIIAMLFFLAVYFAAFTSVVSLTEPAIAYTVEERKVDRRRAALLVCALIYTAGIAVALGARIRDQTLLDLEGGAFTDALLLFGGLLIALYVGWWSPSAQARERMDESEEGAGWRLSWIAFPIVKYVMPVVLIVLLGFALVGTPCALTGGAANGGLVNAFFGVDAIGCAG